MEYNRLKKDIVDIMKHPLKDNGIYYIHDDENILNGYFLIVGPPDTPYEFGFYFFKIEFPKNYPMSPPKITFCNNDNVTNTRFNPNLYRSGKVCVSILNTWRGEGWTSCLTLRTILLSIQSLFNKNPLINEPNISISHISVKPYNLLITHRNIDICIYNIIKNIISNSHNYEEDEKVFYLFNNDIKQTFFLNYDNIQKKIDLLKKSTYNNTTQIVSIYNMSYNIRYDNMMDNIKKIKIELENYS
jgi:ubiquitin-protein ligase